MDHRKFDLVVAGRQDQLEFDGNETRLADADVIRPRRDAEDDESARSRGAADIESVENGRQRLMTSGTQSASGADQDRWAVAVRVILVLLAMRVVWLAQTYYYVGAPRYRLESAAFVLLLVGLCVVLLRTGHTGEVDTPVISPKWLPVFVIAAFCLYWRALSLGLLSDDFVLREWARSDGLGLGQRWFVRPVPLAIWRVLIAATPSATALHAFNVALHGLNAFLVVRLGRMLHMRRDVALVGGFLFLTFPAAPEAVIWASGIQDILLTSFALAVVLTTAREGNALIRSAVAVALFGLALGTKESAVCIPALVVICRATSTRLKQRDEWLLYLVLAVAAGAYVAFHMSVGIADNFLVVPSRYFLKQMVVLAFGTLAAPWQTTTLSWQRPVTLVAVSLLTALVAHAFLIWSRADFRFHRAGRLALWVLAAITPVYSYFFVSPQLEGSRYLYLAECGWALLVSDLLGLAANRLRQPARWLWISAALCAGMSVVMLEPEIAKWRQAAELRDRVLVAAHRVIEERRCPVVQFMDVPDSLDGAYVFRNGLREALDQASMKGVALTADCSVRWNGASFEP